MADDSHRTTHHWWLRFVIGGVVVALLAGVLYTAFQKSPPTPAPSTTTTVTPRPTLSLATIAFATPSTGFGVFTKETQDGKTCQDFVSHSTNGGANFDLPNYVMSWNCSRYEFSSSLAIDEHGDGFLYGPWLYVSHDDAKLWTRSPQPGQVLDVVALGLSVWMVEALCTHADTVSYFECPVRLLESSNGGRTWTPSPTVPPHLRTGLLSGSTNGQTYLVRTNRSTAYLMTAPGPNAHGTSSVVPLWFTSNAGHTWSNRQVTCGIGAWTAAVSQAPGGTLMAVCASQPGAGEQLKSVLESNNDGRSWVTKNRCRLPGTSCSTSNIDFGYLGAIDLVTKSEAFLVGGRSSLQVTHDGGVHWHPVLPLIGGSAGGTTQVVFFDTAHGVVLGQNDNNNEDSTLWSTVDGGKHWTARLPRMG